MADQTWHWTADRLIPSQAGAGQALLEELVGELRRQNWDPHGIFSVNLAVEEALVNAIRHGNRLDADKQVHVCCKVSPDRLWIQIEDQGPGFDPEQVPDCTAPENLECTGGRGIMLMKNYMTRVEYSPGGNRVIMEKVRGSCPSLTCPQVRDAGGH